ncbi:MAG: cysteine synthase family protein [Vicinamibacteria bacterium]|jgi:cysteine synthase A|nr:cysteine synthase family protein [Vicinamibacteria bacterium]
MLDLLTHGRADALRFRGLKHMVGNTPLIAIHLLYRGEPRTIYAKAENLNLTGSIKDRIAIHILRKAIHEGLLAEGGYIAEATSGNTGISFSAVGRALGHPVRIFMPDWMSQERKDLIRSFGAEVELVSREDGGFLGSIARSEAFAKANPGAFLPCQFSNDENAQAHFESTGPEIWWQLDAHNLVPDAFVAGVGTGGTVMGVGRFLRQRNPRVRIHPLEPANSPTLTTGHKVGKHRIQGISDEFIPPILHLNELDKVISVDDGDAILMAQKLATQLGLGVGTSSGANVLGALQVQNQIGPKAVVATILCDSNKKYLSTDLMREEPVKPGFLSPDVELTSAEAFRRVCMTC